jgi:hypothetical protein
MFSLTQAAIQTFQSSNLRDSLVIRPRIGTKFEQRLDRPVNPVLFGKMPENRLPKSTKSLWAGNIQGLSALPNFYKIFDPTDFFDQFSVTHWAQYPVLSSATVLGPIDPATLTSF